MIIENPAARELRAAKQKMLTVEVISASNIPKLEREIVDPYVVVELNGTTTVYFSIFSFFILFYFSSIFTIFFEFSVIFALFPSFLFKFFNPLSQFDKFKTNVVNNNGYNPVWNMACRFEVDEMELAFLVFTIFDKDKMSKDDYMVCNALPLREVRKGYYFLPMKGTQMEDVARCGIYLRFSKD